MSTGNEATVPAEPPTGDGPHGDPEHDRQRSPVGRFERSMASVERDAQAAGLRAQRRTYQQIADALGYSSKGDAWRACQRAKADVARAPVAKLIQAESEELDDLYVMALEVLERNHVVVSYGQIVCDTDGQPLPDDGPRLQAIQTALRVRESYRRLHGIDAPNRVSVEAEQIGRDIGRLLDATLGPEDDAGDDPDA